MNKDYRDLLIELLLDKMQNEVTQKPQIVTASATVTPIKKKKKKRAVYDIHEWTEEEYKFVADAIRSGYTPESISEALGLRLPQITNAIYRLKTGTYGTPALLEGHK